MQSLMVEVGGLVYDLSELLDVLWCWFCFSMLVATGFGIAVLLR